MHEAIASRGTGSAPRCRNPSAATASKLLLGNRSLMKTFKLLSWYLQRHFSSAPWPTPTWSPNGTPPGLTQSATVTRPHRSLPVVSLFFTSQSTTRSTALPAHTNLTWCKAQCRPVRRVKLPQALQRTTRSSICFRLTHPASITSRSDSRRNPRWPAKTAGIVWGEFVANQILAAGPMMVPMLLSRRPVAAVPACGCPRLRYSFLICCRNGDSSRRLQ